MLVRHALLLASAVASVVACTDPRPPPSRALVVDAAAPADPPWQTSHDFDGDHLADRIEVEFTGGAHCCYRLSIALSGTGAVVPIPFELDGGYVGGLTLARPENFTIEDRDGGASLVMTIATYGGRNLPIPGEWKSAYGVTSHRVRVTLRGSTLEVRDVDD